MNDVLLRQAVLHPVGLVAAYLRLELPAAGFGLGKIALVVCVAERFTVGHFGDLQLISNAGSVNRHQ
ncbi:hypothetical protein [Pseudomonas sp. BJP69]|uniref:hypothetical protein n=1 Tax=Pseudomonas sp. BJP69 TaxID=2597770 RepID=UPI001182700A|nr:hypothetical protein [Pseudomonas sp. BJP69]QDR69256.1 hypothetical protein FPB55_17290 [Pseudomonas sp. BJP69]WHL27794.1 hypothetical protein QJS63_26445 [Pseudomonas juntendi]WHL28121.1 hypothetical protein QJS63_28585 [Pseudomonas juntendi]